MTALPARTGSGGITDTATTVGQQKSNLGDIRDYLADLFGTDGTIETAIRTARQLDSQAAINYRIGPSVATNALTLALLGRDGNALSATNPAFFAMRNATPGTGDYITRAVSSAISLTISSGSTLGCGNADSKFIYLYVIDNAGTIELAISSSYFGRAGIVTTTAEGGAGAADSALLMYSTTARTAVPFRCIGRMKAPQTAAGTWSATPTLIETLPFDFTGNVIARATNTALGVQDKGKAIICTAAFTQTLSAAATLGDGWWVAYNAAGFSVTLDPNASELIDAATTKAITSSGFIYCDGVGFYAFGFASNSAAIPKTMTPLLSGSGTYTTPANCIAIKVRMVGAGGGGASNYTYGGTAGGYSQFGTLIAYGGAGGGPSYNFGGAGGGTNGGGNVNILGANGNGGINSVANNILPVSSAGGNSFIGGAGAGVPFGNNGIAGVANTGGGGSSCGGNIGYDIGAGGGAGGYLEKIIYNPAATYSYIVGAGGAPGSGLYYAGGYGGSGCVIVEEYYAS